MQLGKSYGEMIRAEAPGWAVIKSEFALDYEAEHSMDFSAIRGFAASRQSRGMNAGGKSTLALEHIDLAGHKRLTAKLKEMLTEAGLHDRMMSREHYLGKNIPIGGTAHQAGTIRFGADPKTSVLDLNCKAHDLDNLYVVEYVVEPVSLCRLRR